MNWVELMFVSFAKFVLDRFNGTVPDEKMLRNAYQDWLNRSKDGVKIDL